MGIAKVNNIAGSAVAKVNNVAIANIAKVNDVEASAAAATATQWAAASIDHYISWVNAADLATINTWENNVYRIHSTSNDMTDIAYGLDASDNGQWMAVGLAGNGEILFDGNSDITDESAWTKENIDSTHGRRLKILYGAGDGASDSSSGSAETRVGAWLAVGRNAANKVYVYRSTDGGSNWSGLNLDGLTNISGGSSDDWIRGLASDGLGTWMLGLKGNLYISTDSGVSFSYLIQPTGDGTHLIRSISFTNSTWVVITKQGADLHVSTCAASTAANMDASGDWSTSTHIVDTGGVKDLNGNAGADSVKSAAAAGRVCVIDGVNVQPMNVSGKTITMVGTRQTIPDTVSPARCISTDGTTWLIGSGTTSPGDICRSVNGGEAWGDDPIVDGFDASFKGVLAIAPNVLMPL